MLKRAYWWSKRRHKIEFQTCRAELPATAICLPQPDHLRQVVSSGYSRTLMEVRILQIKGQRSEESIWYLFKAGWFTCRFRWGTFSFLLITSVISLVAGDLFVDPIQIEWGSRVNTRITGFSACWFERHDSRQLPFAWFRRDHHRSSSIALPNVILSNFILRFTTCFTYSARIRPTGNSSSAKLRTKNRYI